MDTDWLASALSAALPRTWASFIPAGFEAYVRILHPPAANSTAVTKELTWKEAAAEEKNVLTPWSTWDDIVSDTAPYQKPVLGSSPPEVLEPVLRVILDVSTASREWCLAYWDGYGLRDCPSTAERGRLELPSRTYTVCNQPAEDLNALLDANQSPNLIWPSCDGRPEWVLVIEIDDRSTIVGGAGHLVDRIREVPHLECVTLDHASARFYSP